MLGIPDSSQGIKKIVKSDSKVCFDTDAAGILNGNLLDAVQDVFSTISVQHGVERNTCTSKTS